MKRRQINRSTNNEPYIKRDHNEPTSYHVLEVQRIHDFYIKKGVKAK